MFEDAISLIVQKTLRKSATVTTTGQNHTFHSTIPVIHNARIFHVAERGGTRPKVHLR
jgi:hypothetical protein